MARRLTSLENAEFICSAIVNWIVQRLALSDRYVAVRPPCPMMWSTSVNTGRLNGCTLLEGLVQFGAAEQLGQQLLVDQLAEAGGVADHEVTRPRAARPAPRSWRASATASARGAMNGLMAIDSWPRSLNFFRRLLSHHFTSPDVPATTCDFFSLGISGTDRACDRPPRRTMRRRPGSQGGRQSSRA